MLQGLSGAANHKLTMAHRFVFVQGQILLAVTCFRYCFLQLDHLQLQLGKDVSWSKV